MFQATAFTALVLILASSGAFIAADGARILGIFAFPGPSQYIYTVPYLKTLAARGHDVTVINAFPQKETIANFHDIPVLEIFDTYGEILANVIDSRNRWQELTYLSDFFTLVTTTVLQNAEVQRRLLGAEKPHFDLVILEALHTDALYGFAHYFNAPLIGISTFGTDPTIDSLVDNVSPLAYVPLVTSDLTDRMTFWQRMKNVLLIALEHLHVHLVHLPNQIEIYRKHFPNATANLMDVRKNFSLILLNQHFSLSFARPYVPSLIQAGGMHINYEPLPLPSDMASFIEGSQAEVIYFSLGSNVRSADLPKETVQMMLRVFAKLPQRVMWKFEDADLPNKPENVFIAQWFPQPDILAHPKVKLFITHGGLLSTIEAIYHGKPVVGIPFFYDQFLNVARAEQSGFGVGLKLAELTDEVFHQAIMEVLTNTSYTRVARTMSARYHDQPMKPLDAAIYWTEYVLRHKGAPHMRVAAHHLNFIQRHSLDTIGTLLIGSLVVLSLSICLMIKLFEIAYGTTTKVKSA